VGQTKPVEYKIHLPSLAILPFVTVRGTCVPSFLTLGGFFYLTANKHLYHVLSLIWLCTCQD
jgi:hypothetical protein